MTPAAAPLRMLLALLGGLAILAACTPRETVPTSLAEARARVAGGLRVLKPEGAGPHPSVLVLHGAGDVAWQPVYADMMKGFVARGLAAVFVDMYHGRAIGGAAVRGGALLPRAAAGDVLVGLDWLRRQPWAVADRMALFGVSFGAATIMDTLVLAAPDRMPTSLLEKPPAGLDGVRAAALLAPWCAGDVVGFNLIRAVHQDFARPVPVLAVLPDADTVSDVALCRDILERNRGRGVPVEMVRYQGAGHTFALAVDEYGDPFPDYDARLAADAFRRIHAFLEARLR